MKPWPKRPLAANAAKMPFISYLVENAIAKAKALAYAASEFGVPVMDLNSLNLENQPQKLVDEKIIRKHSALPLFKRGTRLFVAVSDPTNIQALDEIRFHTGMNTDAILVEDDKLRAAIENTWTRPIQRWMAWTMLTWIAWRLKRGGKTLMMTNV